MDSVLDATGRTRERLAPHAAVARDTALHYAGEARDRVGPQLEQAWTAALPKVGQAVERTRHHVRNDLVPAMNRGVEPTVDLVRSRAGVTLSALRGEVTATDLEAIERGRCRRRRARAVFVVAVGVGCACAVAMWWRRRAEPEWMTDEPDLAPVDTVDAVEPDDSASE